MSELDEARERLQRLLEGRYAPRNLTPEEAKRRLLESDPGIDISGFLEAAARGDTARALDNLLYEALAPEAIAFFTPLLSQALRGFLEATREA
ncbi:hypothetical protein [Hydrogenimonas sp.]